MGFGIITISVVIIRIVLHVLLIVGFNSDKGGTSKILNVTFKTYFYIL